jgi:3-hydroxybutyrate dehydrogenase
MAGAKIDLSGKKALITGAASGIGEAVARYFSEMGAALALSDIDAGKLAGVSTTIGARDNLGRRLGGSGC